MSLMSIDFVSTLSSQQRAQIMQLCTAAEAVDPVRPLNEAAMLGLAEPAGQHALLQVGTELAGYGFFDRRDAQLFVAPEFRGHGHGSQLAAAMQARWRPAGWWSFGTLPAAARLADKLDLQPVRRLAKMDCELDDVKQSPAPQLPAGYELVSYQDDDLDALVEVNAAAFKDHPEQGRMTASDAQRRMSQAWFQAKDLLLAKTADGEFAAFHWTKLEAEVGEIYVIAVAPKFARHGLGRALLNAGLHHLQRRGARRVELYVEQNNAPVVRLYQTAGFEITNLDTNYAPISGSNDQPRPSNDELIR